jgi:hypothetical protein
MNMTQRWVMGIVVVLLVSVGFVANALFLQTSDQLKKAQAEIAQLKTQPTTEPAPDDSASEKNMLARVADLLPEGAYITNTLALQNDLTLVGSAPIFDGGSEQKSMTLWIADPANNKISELTHHDTTGPGVSTSFDMRDYPPLATVHTLVQWEGYDERATDYVNSASGTLLLTQQWHNGQEIDLTRNGKTLKIELAPKGGCGGTGTLHAGPVLKDSVSGILVNGIEIKFKKAYTVECSHDDEAGLDLYPAIPEISYDGQATAQGENTAYVNLPFGKVNLTIDVDKLDASGIRISE